MLAEASNMEEAKKAGELTVHHSDQCAWILPSGVHSSVIIAFSSQARFNTPTMQLPFDVLILGAGWTSTFLIPLCKERSLTYCATTRDGRDGTLEWGFDPDSEDESLYTALPDAKTVLITFPITQPGASARLVRLYSKTRKNGELRTRFIQLGSTGVWDVSPSSPRSSRTGMSAGPKKRI